MFQNITQIVKNKQCHYIAVKQLSALLRGMTSKHHGHLYRLNCLHCFPSEKNLNHIKNLFESKEFCSMIMPIEDPKFYEFNQYQKSDKHHLLFM